MSEQNESAAPACPGCPRAIARAKMRPGREVPCAWPGCEASYRRERPEAPVLQRTAPPTVTLTPMPDRNRRNRDRVWNLISDMTILARHFSAIEGRAQSIEPDRVQNNRSAHDENDRKARERATAVLIHQRWRGLSGIHAAVIEFAMIRRDGSKLGDDDTTKEKDSHAQTRARETAFERLAVAFADREQREAWSPPKQKPKPGEKPQRQQRAISQGAMRQIGEQLFKSARRAYESNGQ